MSSSLAEILARHGASKAAHSHYAGLYECYLGPRRHEVRDVLELGVAQGGSLLAWLEWFPDAVVTGVDTSPVDDIPGLSGNPRCRVLCCDQTDPHLAEMGSFDVVVDDAGHDPRKQIDSLEMLWPKVKRGGYYVVEDTETSYWEPFYPGSWVRASSAVEALKAFVDGLNVPYIRADARQWVPHLEGLVGMHWHSNIVFLQKG